MEAVAPPAVLHLVRVQHTEAVGKAGIQQLGHFSAFLIGEACAHAVGLCIFDVDLRMGHIQVPAQDHRLFRIQRQQIGAEGVLPFHAVVQTLQPVLTVGGIAAHQIEVRVLRRDEPTFVVVRVKAQPILDGKRGLFRQNRRAGIALFLGGIKIAVIAVQLEDGLLRLELRLLQAEDVRLFLVDIFQKALGQTRPQTVDVPDSDPDDDVDDGHTGIALTITITAKTAEQMRMEYSFTKYQNDALDILLENLGSLNIPMGSLTISQEDAIELLENLPDDLDPARKAVVETAVQLVGRVSYFWGGKSLTLGWDDRWGTPMEVTAAGSGSTGTIRPFGLDCSGFVDWTFYNATNGSYYPGRGGGAATQHSYCINISWSDAQPGDLVFYPADVHVGIVGGRDTDGNLLIVHCSGGANGVVITGSAGFTSVARPDCFANES